MSSQIKKCVWLPVAFISLWILPLKSHAQREYVYVQFPNNVVLDSQDQPVGSNRTVWVGTFTNSNPAVTNPSFVMDLARTSTNGNGVLAAWTSNFARLVQTNFLGQDLVLTNRPSVAMTNRPIYVWMFNHTNPSAATEMILWRSQNPEFFDRNNDPALSYVPVTLDPANTNKFGADFYGSAPLFGQYLPQAGCWRMSPIATHLDRRTTVEQISLSGVDWFIGDTNAALDLPANNGPTGFTVVVTNNGSTSPLSTLGLSYSNGRISGLLTATNTNQHVLWVTATNSHGLTAAASNTLTLRVRSQTGPLFTNPGVMSLTAGTDFAGFQLLTESSTNLPLSFTCLNGSELAGLSLSSAGLFSGTSFNTNTRLLRLQVQDSAGNVRRGSLTYVGTAPSLTIAATNAEGVLEIPYGTQANFPVTYPSGFDDGTLEAELTGSEINGVASATFDGATLTILTNRPPTPRGSNPVVQILANRTNLPTIPPKVVTASTQIPVRILAPRPVVSLPSLVRLFVGEATNLSLADSSTFSGPLTTFQVSNPPTGISYNASSKLLGGTNLSTNQFRWTTRVTADNRADYYGGGVSDPGEIIFEITNRRPEFLPNQNIILLAGLGRSFAANFNFANFPTTAVLTGLPPGITNAGLSLQGTNTTLTLRGVPTAGGPPSSVQLEASNQSEPGNPDSPPLQTATSFTIHVASTRPPASVAPTSPGTLPAGTTIALSNNVYLLDAATSGVRVSAYGLPPGISLDRASGKLFGTTGGPGSYTATVFIQNARGWIKKTVQLTVQ